MCARQSMFSTAFSGTKQSTNKDQTSTKNLKIQWNNSQSSIRICLVAEKIRVKMKKKNSESTSLIVKFFGS